MNKLILIGIVVTGMSVAALAAPGCADTCEELAVICDTCGDADYQGSCDATVAENNQDVCSFQKDYYDRICNETGEAGAGGGTGNSCTHGQALCQGQCVDLEADPGFCGSCNTVCPTDAPFCQAGSCVAACTAPFVACGNGCIDTSSDPLHCGGCAGIDGVVCGADQVCDAGVCADGCDPNGPNPAECDGSCVNLAQDLVNCGECGNTCGAGILCSGGTCSSTCDPTLTACDGTCVDLVSDGSHCGACGTDCAANGQVCLNGSCEDNCGGLTTCGSSCVDLLANGANCGTCGNLCTDGTVCSNGQCTSTCAAGQLECNGGCVSADSDAFNCGACGRTCDSDEVCSDGACVECTPVNDCGDDDCAGKTLCGPTNQNCVDTATDPRHCGGCDQAVAPGQVCDNGEAADECSGNTTACNGSCVDLSADNPKFCGSCDNNCNDNNLCTQDSCVAGQCENDSGAIACSDGDPCTDDVCVPETGACTNPDYTQSKLVQLCGLAGTTINAGDCAWCDASAGDTLSDACMRVTMTGSACTPNAAGMCGSTTAMPDATGCADDFVCNAAGNGCDPM